MKVLIVGEAEGENEAKAGHPFVGSSGLELAKMGTQAGFFPPIDTGLIASTVYPPSASRMIKFWAAAREHGIGVTNVFNAHPPGNRIEHFFVGKSDRANVDLPMLRNGKYISPEHMHHVIRLWDEISTTRPNLILALGNSALWATVRISGIGNARGCTDLTPSGVKVLPTYHPAAVLRQWSLRTIVLRDLQRAKAESAFPEIRRRERWITTLDPNESGITLANEWLDRPADQYANDIETERGQISMVSFARTPSDALVIPLIGEDHKSFWPTPELEAAAWKCIKRGLDRPIPKVYQNGLYDMSYYLRLGMFPTKPWEDTMLRQHAHLIEHPKGLGYLASIYLEPGEMAWKVMRREKGTELKRDE